MSMNFRWNSLKKCHCCLPFPKISRITRSQFLHYGIIQHFTYKKIIIRNNINSVCLYIAPWVMLLHYFSTIFEIARIWLILHGVTQKLIFCAFRRHCLHSWCLYSSLGSASMFLFLFYFKNGSPLCWKWILIKILTHNAYYLNVHWLNDQE